MTIQRDGRHGKVKPAELGADHRGGADGGVPTFLAFRIRGQAFGRIGVKVTVAADKIRRDKNVFWLLRLTARLFWAVRKNFGSLHIKSPCVSDQRNSCLFKMGRVATDFPTSKAVVPVAISFPASLSFALLV